MSVKIRAHYDGKNFVPDEPVDMPQDQELEIDVRLASKSLGKRMVRRRQPSVTSMPFFGIWADREDMQDSITWVRKERERWNERLSSRD